MHGVDQGVGAFVELVVAEFQLSLKRCDSATICRAGGYGVEDEAGNAADDVDQNENHDFLHKRAALLRRVCRYGILWIVEGSEYLKRRCESCVSLLGARAQSIRLAKSDIMESKWFSPSKFAQFAQRSLS